MRAAEDRSGIFEPFRLAVEFRQRFRPADHPHACEGCVLLACARAAHVPAAVLGVADVEQACLATLLRMRGEISARGVILDQAKVLSGCGGRHEHICGRARLGCRKKARALGPRAFVELQPILLRLQPAPIVFAQLLLAARLPQLSQSVAGLKAFEPERRVAALGITQSLEATSLINNYNQKTLITFIPNKE